MPTLPELPPIAAAPLSVVLLPASGSVDREPIVQQWLVALTELERTYEVLLIADEQDAGWADALAQQEPRLRVLRLAAPQQFGSALTAALREARQPLLFHVPCAPAVAPAHLRRLLDRIDGSHLAVGYRAGTPVPLAHRVLRVLWGLALRVLPGVPQDYPPGWLGRRAVWYGFAVRLLFGVRIADVESPIKLFRREIFDRLPIQSAGQFAHAEILAKANFFGCIMDEVPLDIAPEWVSDPTRRREGSHVFGQPTFIEGPPKQSTESAAPS